MEASHTKILCTILIVTLSGTFGFIPFLFKNQMEGFSPSDPNYNKKKRKNRLLACLLNFGGGVLIANCFCHWLPEVREGMMHKNIDTVLPLAEVIMCAGFFGICIVEELIQWCLRPRRKINRVRPDEDSEKSSKQIATTSFDEKLGENCSKNRSEKADFDKPTPPSDDSRKSVIRTFFVVSALSFHSTVEGLALGIEQSTSGIWLNFGATALHKFVIAFSVGVELVSSQTSKLNYFISILVFSFAPAIGVGIAVLIGEFQTGMTEFDDFPLQILQGLATGTVVYVVFFEIFPKGIEIGGSGFNQVISMTLGFATFLPSLFLQEMDDSDQKDSTNGIEEEDNIDVDDNEEEENGDDPDIDEDSDNYNDDEDSSSQLHEDCDRDKMGLSSEVKKLAQGQPITHFQMLHLFRKIMVATTKKRSIEEIKGGIESVEPPEVEDSDAPSDIEEEPDAVDEPPTPRQELAEIE